MGHQSFPGTKKMWRRYREGRRCRERRNVGSINKGFGLDVRGFLSFCFLFLNFG